MKIGIAMKIAEHEITPYRAEQRLDPGPALVLAPHPDDEVFGCGGAIMRHLAAADPVTVIIVTDGAYGAAPDAADAYVAQRRHESRAAAAVLGYGEPHFWGLPDRGLEYGEPLIERIRAAIAASAARSIYAPSWWEVHPDHLALSLATAEAVRRTAHPCALLCYEVGVPLHPNLLLDITADAPRKAAAIRCFASQLAVQDYDRHLAALNVYRTYTLPPSVRAAEAYRRLTPEALRRDPLQLLRPGDYYSQQRTGIGEPPPLISVILLGAALDGLRDRLDALALQTYSNIEILLLGAERPSGSAVLGPAGTRFALRWLEPPAGSSLAEQTNLGLAAARGALIAILEPGLILLPDHFEALQAVLAAEPRLRCAHAAVEIAASGDTVAGSLPTTTLAAPLVRARLWRGATRPLGAFLLTRALIAAGCRCDLALDLAGLTPAEQWQLAAWDLLVQCSRATEFGFRPAIGLRCTPVPAGDCRVPGQVATGEGRRVSVPGGLPTAALLPTPPPVTAGDSACLSETATWNPDVSDPGLQGTTAGLVDAAAGAEPALGPRLLARGLDKWRTYWTGAEIGWLIAELPQTPPTADSGAAVTDRVTGQVLTCASCADLERQFADLRQDHQRVTARAEQLAADLRALQASTAWRITAPLRRLLARLRGQAAQAHTDDV